MEALTTFAERIPAWVGPDGYPLSWRHYQVGMARIGRSDAQWMLRVASAASIAQATEKSAKRWWDDMRAHAGWH